MSEEFNMVNKAFTDMVFFHSFFMAFLPIPFLINLYALFTFKTYQKVIIKLWFVMPIIFLLIAIGTFSGLFILASQQWYIGVNVIYMIIYMIFVFVGEIIRIKKLKLAKTNEYIMHRFIVFCRILYLLDLFGSLLFVFRVII